MDCLYSIFEKQLELQKDDDGNAVIGSSVFSPVTILRADEIAYKDEFNNWLNERWLPEQKETLQRTLGIRANRDRFIDLCKTLRNEQLIPFVGSGMSIPSGLKSWSDFLRGIRYYSSMGEVELEELLSKGAYEEAADQLSATMPRRLLDERIEHDLWVDNSADICGAITFLPELFDKLVLTTNLDDLLEQIYELRGRRFGPILAGQSISSYRKVKATSERILLKLHGDRRSQDGRVLGKSEYDKVYATDSPVREELTTIYRTYSLLFLGCSLNRDRTVELVAEVTEKDPRTPNHYTFLQLPEQDQDLIPREHFLIERGIFPIWYPGDHDASIQALFVGMLQYLGRL